MSEKHYTENSNMEAGDGFQNVTMKLVPWRDDWEQFRRLFNASARLNEASDAVKAGENLAVLVYRSIIRGSSSNC